MSHVTTQTFDQLNRLSTHKDAAQNLSSIKYDSHSRPLTVTDPRGNATTYVYNGFGDTIQQTSPDTLTTIYFYDADSNLTGKNQTGINFSSATYDACDRMLTRTYPADSTLNVSITYDSAAAGYKRAIGRIASLTDQAGSLSRSYDERGNIITDARTITSQLYTNGYTYESAGRLVRHHLRQFRLESGLHPRQRRADYRRHRRRSPATARPTSPRASRICPSAPSPP